MAAEGGASSSLRCFQSATMQMSESNYSPIKDKDVTWEGAETQQLTVRQAGEGEAVVFIKKYRTSHPISEYT